jgi:hypothetical protein
MQMNDNQPDQERATSVMLAAAGIPVPNAEVSKIAQMQRNAADARLVLRALRLMEAEPVTVFASRDMNTEDGRE